MNMLLSKEFQNNNTTPFLKWVGGKRSALEHLKQRLPHNYTKYYECFLGGGALFFNIQPKSAYLCDINYKLIATYKALKQDVKSVIKQLKHHKAKHSEKYYYKAREQFNKETDLIKRASLFIYLNKTCYNGLYRVNSNGGFNAPYGKYNNPAIFNEQNLFNISKLLKKAVIKNQSFDKTKIISGAFYYLDPPYHNTYDQYDKNKFNFSCQKQLKSFCKEIDKNGAYFLQSNADTKEVRELYKEFVIETVKVSKSVSCKSHQRRKEKELVIKNYG